MNTMIVTEVTTAPRTIGKMTTGIEAVGTVSAAVGTMMKAATMMISTASESESESDPRNLNLHDDYDDGFVRKGHREGIQASCPDSS
jgi:hypothetical protein